EMTVADALSRQEKKRAEKVEEVVLLKEKFEIAVTSMEDKMGFWTELRASQARHGFEGVDEEKEWVPPEEGICSRLLFWFHDHPLAGHPGEKKTVEAIAENFKGPRLCKFIKKYVASCEPCQKTVMGQPLTTTKMKPNKPTSAKKCNLPVTQLSRRPTKTHA